MYRKYHEVQDSWGLFLELNGVIKGVTSFQTSTTAYGSFNEVNSFEAAVLDTTFATNHLVRIPNPLPILFMEM